MFSFLILAAAGLAAGCQGVNIRGLRSGSVSTGTGAGGSSGARYPATRIDLYSGGRNAGSFQDGIGSNANFYSPADVTSDGTHLYVADRYNHTIRKIAISTREVTTFAGSPGQADDVDGIGPDARLNEPLGITNDGTDLYVSTRTTIRKISLATAQVTTLAGAPNVAASTDGTGAAAAFIEPAGIVVVGGVLYIAETGGQKIRRLVISTRVVTTFAGSGTSGNADATGTSATFLWPRGITTDGTNLYVVTSGCNVRRIVIATAVVTTLAGSGGCGDQDGTGLAAKFNDPQGITTDGTVIYISDFAGHRIRKLVISTGVVTTIAGGPSASSQDGTGTSAWFNAPKGLTLIGSSLFVADSRNNAIRELNTSNNAVTILAGNTLRANEGYVDSATASAVRFSTQLLTVTDGTYLYVADTRNRVIRKVQLSNGATTTLAGSGLSGNADGLGAAASFEEPTGLSLVGPHLYVTDPASDLVRKIVLATGMVTTVGPYSGNSIYDVATDGSYLYYSSFHTILRFNLSTGVETIFAGSGSAGSLDATGTSAEFNSPTVVVSDSNALYVADNGNYTIRQISLATQAVTTLAGTPGIQGNSDGTGPVASFSNYISGMVSDGTDLYVSDGNSGTLRKIAIASGAVTTLKFQNGTAVLNRVGSTLYTALSNPPQILATDLTTLESTCIAGPCRDDNGYRNGAASMARFSGANGMTSVGTDLYVSDSDNNLIRKIDTLSGTVSTFVGAPIEGAVDAVGTAARFAYPAGIVATAGHLYVAEYYGCTIRDVDIANRSVTTIVGVAGACSHADGIGTSARLLSPYMLTTDGTSLYVADYTTVRKIVISTRQVTTLAGTPNVTGSVDGPAGSALFSWLGGILLRGTDLYLSDQNSLRKLDLASNTVSTVAGGASSGFQDGLAGNARFNWLLQPALYGETLYLPDYLNHSIRTLDLATGQVGTLVGTPSCPADVSGLFTDPVGLTSPNAAYFMPGLGLLVATQFNIRWIH